MKNYAAASVFTVMALLFCPLQMLGKQQLFVQPFTMQKFYLKFIVFL